MRIESNNTKILLSLTASFIIIYSLQAAAQLLIPFLLAIFIALITLKPMFWLQEKKVPGVLAAFLIVIFIMLVLSSIGSIVGSSIVEFTNVNRLNYQLIYNCNQSNSVGRPEIA